MCEIDGSVDEKSLDPPMERFWLGAEKQGAKK